MKGLLSLYLILFSRHCIFIINLITNLFDHYRHYIEKHSQILRTRQIKLIYELMKTSLLEAKISVKNDNKCGYSLDREQRILKKNHMAYTANYFSKTQRINYSDVYVINRLLNMTFILKLMTSQTCLLCRD